MRIQLWSYNYDPEPTGIGPVSTVWARAMVDRGHEVSVVAAHPHYPVPNWGWRARPYRERRDGIELLRLPLWAGRLTAGQRIRQELTFTAALTAALPALPRPDVIVAVTPSFPALGPARLQARLRRVPWVLWLQDVLPDGATSSGVLSDGLLVRQARRFELAAYRSAARIVVVGENFVANLRAKGVPEHKLERIYNPATRPLLAKPRPEEQIDHTVLAMGNIGRSQNLAEVVRAFEASPEVGALGVRLVIAGEGVERKAVSAVARDRVKVPGLLEDSVLEQQLRRASIGLISQHYRDREFNLPSKLMNLMGYGIPVVVAAPPESELAQLVRSSGCGWVVPPPESKEFGEALAAAVRDTEGRRSRGEAGRCFARHHFSPAGIAEQFERVLAAAVGRGGAPDG